jgi:uncharacterized protein YqgV (UPF0045/DUF77 family)
MCNVEKTRIMSCQLSFYPLYTTNCKNNVNKVVEMIEESGLYCQVNDMSTIIKGEGSKVMKLLDQIRQRMDKDNISFTMVAVISNVCGCNTGV